MSSVASPLPAAMPNETPSAGPGRANPSDYSLGMIYILCVPVLAGIATVRGVDIGGFNYGGFLWVFAFVIGALLLLDQLSLRPRGHSSWPTVPWLLYLGYLGLSLFWLDEITYAQVQTAAQMGMPALVGALASFSVRTRQQLEQLVQTYFFSMWLLLGFVGLCFVGILSQNELDPVFVAVRSLSLTLVVIGALFMAGSQRNLIRSWLGWAACLTVTVLTGSRMASLALLMLPILNPVTRQLFFKAAAVMIVVLVTIGLASTTMFQERFFHSGSGDIDDMASGDFDNFDSSGRFDSWPVLLDEALKRPWLGHGVGSVQVFLPTIWSEVSHPHNDYLRLLFELGFIGLALFLAAVLRQMWTLRSGILRTSGVVQQAYGAAWLGLAAFLLIAITDNPIVYHVWYMNPLFALIGATCAVATKEEIKSKIRSQESGIGGLEKPISSQETGVSSQESGVAPDVRLSTPVPSTLTPE